MFDISALAADETFDVQIINPNTAEPIVGEDNTPMSVTVFGPGTKPFAAARSAQSNRATKRIRARGKTDTTPEEDAQEIATFLTAITRSFNGFNYKGMEPGAEMFRALYLDPTMGFITDKVNREAGDWGNFTKASANS